MVPWLIVGGVMIFQALQTFRLGRPVDFPLTVSLVVPIVLLLLSRFVALVHRPALVIFAIGALIGMNTGLMGLSSFVAGGGWAAGGVLLIAYTVRRRDELKTVQSGRLHVWRLVALILLAAVLLLPPVSC